MVHVFVSAITGAVSYMLEKLNDDGGFCFCKPFPSSIPETFYAVKILSLSGEEIPEKTREFLENLRNIKNPYACYHAISALKILKEDVRNYMSMMDYYSSKLEGYMSWKGLKAPSGMGNLSTYSFNHPLTSRTCSIFWR